MKIAVWCVKSAMCRIFFCWGAKFQDIFAHAKYIKACPKQKSRKKTYLFIGANNNPTSTNTLTTPTLGRKYLH